MDNAAQPSPWPLSSAESSRLLSLLRRARRSVERQQAERQEPVRLISDPARRPWFTSADDVVATLADLDAMTPQAAAAAQRWWSVESRRWETAAELAEREAEAAACGWPWPSAGGDQAG